MTEGVVIGSFLFIIYTYFGYPAILWVLRQRSPIQKVDPLFTPRVTVVISAFNEQQAIGDTLTTILASDYPAASFDVVVISDASSDRTDAIVQSFDPSRVHFFRQPTRSGQAINLEKGARIASGEILFMADASGRFFPNTLRQTVRHFGDAHVGAVSGYKVIRKTGAANSIADGVYARYDRTLRQWESETGSSWVGCQGGAFAIRKTLYRTHFPLSSTPDTSMGYDLYRQGYLHRYDPDIQLVESPSLGLTTEFSRKIRLVVGQLHGVLYFRRLFNPFRHPAFFFQNVSHKVFRWLVPFALILMWGASFGSAIWWVRLFFLLQTLFYGTALIGITFSRRQKLPKILAIPAYFVMVNLGALLAWPLAFRDYTIWVPPSREEGQKG